MKIRTDYVTNSSSSSFIIGFKNKKAYEEGLKELGEYICKSEINSTSLSLSDAKVRIDNNRLTYRELLRVYKDKIRYKVKYDLLYSRPDYDYPVGYRNSDEFKEILERELDAQLELLKSKITPRGIYSIIEYHDEWGEGCMEHRIMPNMPFVLEVISHH